MLSCASSITSSRCPISQHDLSLFRAERKKPLKEVLAADQDGDATSTSASEFDSCDASEKDSSEEDSSEEEGSVGLYSSDELQTDDEAKEEDSDDEEAGRAKKKRIRCKPLYGCMFTGDFASTCEAVLQALCSGAFSADSGFAEQDQAGVSSLRKSLSLLLPPMPYASFTSSPSLPPASRQPTTGCSCHY